MVTGTGVVVTTLVVTALVAIALVVTALVVTDGEVVMGTVVVTAGVVTAEVVVVTTGGTVVRIIPAVVILSVGLILSVTMTPSTFFGHENTLMIDAVLGPGKRIFAVKSILPSVNIA